MAYIATLGPTLWVEGRTAWQADHLLLQLSLLDVSQWGEWSRCSLGCPTWLCLQMAQNAPTMEAVGDDVIHHRQLFVSASI